MYYIQGRGGVNCCSGQCRAARGDGFDLLSSPPQCNAFHVLLLPPLYCPTETYLDGVSCVAGEQCEWGCWGDLLGSLYIPSLLSLLRDSPSLGPVCTFPSKLFPSVITTARFMSS